MVRNAAKENQIENFLRKYGRCRVEGAILRKALQTYLRDSFFLPLTQKNLSPERGVALPLPLIRVLAFE
jgi:hypothetical protein